MHLCRIYSVAGERFRAAEEKDRIVVQAVGGWCAEGSSRRDIHRQCTKFWQACCNNWSLGVTHWLFTSSFRNCWGFFKAKECVAPLLPPIFTYVHSFTRFFYKKKGLLAEKFSRGRRTEFQHRDQEWKHASAPHKLPGPESSVKAKELTLFSFVQSTHLTSAGSKGEDEKIKHTFIICHSLRVAACFRFSLFFFSLCKRQSALLCQFACSSGVLFLFLIKQFAKAELLKLYSQR